MLVVWFIILFVGLVVVVMGLIFYFHVVGCSCYMEVVAGGVVVEVIVGG